MEGKMIVDITGIPKEGREANTQYMAHVAKFFDKFSTISKPKARPQIDFSFEKKMNYQKKFKFPILSLLIQFVEFRHLD